MRGSGPSRGSRRGRMSTSRCRHGGRGDRTPSRTPSRRAGAAASREGAPSTSRCPRRRPTCRSPGCTRSRCSGPSTRRTGGRVPAWSRRPSRSRTGRAGSRTCSPSPKRWPRNRRAMSGSTQGPGSAEPSRPRRTARSGRRFHRRRRRTSAGPPRRTLATGAPTRSRLDRTTRPAQSPPRRTGARGPRRNRRPSADPQSSGAGRRPASRSPTCSRRHRTPTCR